MPIFHNDFEETVYDTLEKFEFIKLHGGTKCKLSGQQIDIYFDYKELRVIFECKERDAEYISLIEPINKLASVIDDEKRKNPNKIFKGVIATNLNWRDIKAQDVQRANNKGFKIWTISRLKFYDKLVYALNPRLALLSMLKDEFKYVQQSGEIIEVPAIRTVRFGKELYTFEMEASKLLDLAYVFRLTDPQTEAYQRMIEPKRLNEIANSIQKGVIDINFPNNIIVSFQGGVEWEPTDSNMVKLKIPYEYGIAWVVDGQHRLFSFCKVKDQSILNDFKFIVTAFQGLSKGEQAVVFRVINNKLKKINANLVDFLLSKETNTDDPRSIAARVIIRFHEEQFFDYDVNFGFNKGKLRLSNLVTGLTKQGLIGRRKLIQKNAKDEQTPYLILKQYFLALGDTFPSNWNKDDSYVQSNNGLNVFFIILKLIIKHMDLESKDELDNLTKKKFLKYLKPLQRTRFSEEIRYLTSSEAGRAEFARTLANKIDRKFRGFVKE